MAAHVVFFVYPSKLSEVDLKDVQGWRLITSDIGGDQGQQCHEWCRTCLRQVIACKSAAIH